MEHYDVIIVGGGAAGLSCAVAMPEKPRFKVLVLEAGERAGKKLSATGNGQGNICNNDMSAAHYRSGDIAAVERIVGGYNDERPDEWACQKLFGNILYRCDGMGRIYPYSMQASSLTDILLSKLRKKGAELRLGTRVADIGRGFVVDCGNVKFSADNVVLATGGKAQKQFLTDGSAYSLAKKFGHTLTPLYPSIVQLKTDTRYIKGLKGIRVNCFVKAYVGGNLKKQILADIIFTDYGVSGNAAFYLSGELAARGGTISIDFLPDFSADTLTTVLTDRLADGTDIQNILCGILHNRIALAILNRAGEAVPDIVRTAKNFTLNVNGTLGFDYAQVTQGGVSMTEVDSNLQSKLCKGLYFAGEILDVDGDCGGYNLHWAFASGITVAEAISKLYD